MPSDESRITALESELATIKLRNQQVEIDKSWETSLLRRTLVALITYFAAGILLALIGNQHYIRNALVPVLGYLLSTWSIPSAKKIWKQQRGV
jgi:hypothetical protein